MNTQNYKRFPYTRSFATPFNHKIVKKRFFLIQLLSQSLLFAWNMNNSILHTIEWEEIQVSLVLLKNLKEKENEK